MQEYDVALKVLLQGQARRTISELTGSGIARWLDVELPKVQNLRLDLLGGTVADDLIHLELQSGNDAGMPLRMAEYCLGVYRLFGRFPRQVLLYVGEAPLRMATKLSGGGLSFEYQAVDIRSLDGDQLLESDEVGDNVIAILTHVRDHKEAVRKIVARLAGLPPGERANALEQLFILAGLRRLEETVEREARKMPIYIDILENKVLGRERKKGIQEGRQEGRQEGELTILRRLIERRFGTLPAWAEQRLGAASTEQLEELATRVLDAARLEDLLNAPPA
jgi:hypothetical protein